VLNDRAPWVLVVLGALGLVISITVLWGLVGSNWQWVRDYRAGFGAPPSRDRARLLAAFPAGSIAVVLTGLFLAAADPVAAQPLAVASVAFLVLAIGMGIRPDPFLPRWARGGDDALATGNAVQDDRRDAERESTRAGRGITFGLGLACVPIGLGLSQVPVPGLAAVGLGMAALGGLGVAVALRHRRT
jgi:hypothetical protein